MAEYGGGGLDYHCTDFSGEKNDSVAEIIEWKLNDLMAGGSHVKQSTKKVGETESWADLMLVDW